MQKKIKVSFSQNFLETFDGTQEELDSMIEQIKQYFENTDFDALAEEQGVIFDDFDEEAYFPYNEKTLH